MYYLFLAEGFEEVEALTPLDYLRRADIEVRSVGVTGEYVTGAHDITVRCDRRIDEIQADDTLEGVILPGGMPGVKNLEANEKLLDLLHFAAQNKKLIGAICAAPSIPGKLGLLEGRRAVCYPGFETYLAGAFTSQEKVVTDENFVTSRGAGTANLFAFSLIAYIKGEKEAEKIAQSVIYR